MDTGATFGAGLRAALIAGHAGHELKVFGWMAECRPRVCCITDGSGGSTGKSRVGSTRATIAAAGAQASELLGITSDEEIYRAILEQDLGWFRSTADALAAALVREQIELVAGDAAEGFNPTHDLCRVLINAAVEMAEATSGRRIANLAFPLADSEFGKPLQHDGECLHLRLAEPALAAKLKAAQDYHEMQAEVQRALAFAGREYFREECLREVRQFGLDETVTPFYESCGERRVEAGKYEAVIRLREHVLPIVEDLRAHAGVRAHMGQMVAAAAR
jgi:hypothetical protein